MSLFQSEAFLLCLLASIVWAPFVYAGALILDRRQTLAVSEKIWLSALAIAVLPTMLAPAFSSAGFSLRPASIAYPLSTPAPPGPAPTPSAEPAVFAAASSADAAPAADDPIIIDPAPIVASDSSDPVFFSAPELMSSVSGLSPETILNMVGLLYIYGALLAFGIWLMRSTGFALNVLRADPVADPALFEAVGTWRRQMGVRQKLRIKQSRMVSSVCVTGYFQPVILIPTDIRRKVTFDDLVMMCAHELAHIKRGDVRLFTVSAAARILFWFNPFLKRITARAELAAEQCADALVVSSGVNRRDYAACFVEGLRFAASRPAQAFAALPTFTPLDRKGRRKRLDSILSATAQAALPPRTKLLLGAAALSASAAVFTQAAVAVHPATAENSHGLLTQSPLDGRLTLTHGAQWKDRKTGEIRGPHQGVDIAAKRGADVVAPGAGVVVEATDLYENNPDWGKVIVIDHGDNVKTRYAHLDSYGVLKGDRVWAGDVIAKVGSTGRSTGPHLHFETIVDGETVDPLTVLKLDPPEPPKAPSPLQSPSPVPSPVPSPGPSLETALAAPADPPAPKPAPSALKIFTDGDIDEEIEAFVDELGDIEIAIAEDVEEIVETIVENTLVEARIETAPRARTYSYSYSGGEELSRAQREKMERALEKMRREVRKNSKEREYAKRKAKYDKDKAKHAKDHAKHQRDAALHAKKHAQKLAEQQRQHAQQQLQYAFQHNQMTRERVLSIRDEALESARRSLIDAEKHIQQSLRQAERSLDQSERSIKLAKLPKKDIEAFKKDIERARKELRREKSDRLEALREAERTIAEQQDEIERLRAELKQKELAASAQ
ncbi:MAG: peptidoglycan DD-metalloendopeptidase family protein [Pseudomonadota bacterium]